MIYYYYYFLNLLFVVVVIISNFAFSGKNRNLGIFSSTNDRNFPPSASKILSDKKKIPNEMYQIRASAALLPLLLLTQHKQWGSTFLFHKIKRGLSGCRSRNIVFSIGIHFIDPLVEIFLYFFSLQRNNGAMKERN